LLPEGYLVTLVGEPGCGKSYLSYVLSLALATRTTVLERELFVPRTVLYFDQENSRPDRDEYVRMAWHGLGRPSISLLERHFWPQHFTLGDLGWYKTMTACIEEIRPDLVVVDTATPSFCIRDEDKNAEAGFVINQLRVLQRTYAPLTFLVLKHQLLVHERQQRLTVRGAKHWEGAADSVLFYLKAPGRKAQDGLHAAYLESIKGRAFGLSSGTQLHVKPTWTADRKGKRLGLYVPSAEWQ